MKISSLFATISTLFIATNIYAAANTSTANITLVNSSNETFTYTTVDHVMPTNIYSVSDTTLAPGASIVISGTTTTSNDLVGILHFVDSDGTDNTFTIIDYRKIKIGQPSFSLDTHNPKFKSTVVSRSLSKKGDGRAVAYTAATVEITDK